jgi:hypothetical protein
VPDIRGFIKSIRFSNFKLLLMSTTTCHFECHIRCMCLCFIYMHTIHNFSVVILEYTFNIIVVILILENIRFSVLKIGTLFVKLDTVWTDLT